MSRSTATPASFTSSPDVLNATRCDYQHLFLHFRHTSTASAALVLAAEAVLGAGTTPRPSSVPGKDQREDEGKETEASEKDEGYNEGEDEDEEEEYLVRFPVVPVVPVMEPLVGGLAKGEVNKKKGGGNGNFLCSAVCASGGVRGQGEQN